jgi:hypothetical protein
MRRLNNVERKSSIDEHRWHWAEVLEVETLAPAAPQAFLDALTKDENGQAEISSV